MEVERPALGKAVSFLRCFTNVSLLAETRISVSAVERAVSLDWLLFIGAAWAWNQKWLKHASELLCTPPVTTSGRLWIVCAQALARSSGKDWPLTLARIRPQDRRRAVRCVCNCAVATSDAARSQLRVGRTALASSW